MADPKSPTGVTRRFKKQLRAKSEQDRVAIQRALERLLDDPGYPSLETKKVRGTDGIWEARASRSLRVTFEFDEAGYITLRNNCSHDAVLRDP